MFNLSEESAEVDKDFAVFINPEDYKKDWK